EKVGELVLHGYAVEILPKLGFHEENQMKMICLGADCADQITEILETEDRSIWVGKVKSLDLTGYPAELLLKITIHKENQMEELRLSAKGNISWPLLSWPPGIEFSIISSVI
ncbi:MAG: uncharacterized protein A8A55_3377, partial [Amphiamblys sp. WSBS2006]